MKDPAFLFYDGDAAKDVSHMNRLERGCYFDLIQAQRKFGRLPIDLIKKILGKDFETCWESVKICLSYVNDMYYIEWLENSTIKRKEYSESRRKNRMTDKQQDTKIISESYVNHMENEIENEDKNLFTYNDLDSVQSELLTSDQWIEITAMSLKTDTPTIKSLIPVYCLEQKSKGKIGSILKEYKSHFYNWARIKLQNQIQTPGPVRKEITEEQLMREKAERIAGYAKR